MRSSKYLDPHSRIMQMMINEEETVKCDWAIEEAIEQYFKRVNDKHQRNSQIRYGTRIGYERNWLRHSVFGLIWIFGSDVMVEYQAVLLYLLLDVQSEKTAEMKRLLQNVADFAAENWSVIFRYFSIT